MNKLIQAYLDAEKEALRAYVSAIVAAEAAELAQLPAKLRPAEPKDIVVGNIIWYPTWEERMWNRVDEVIRPNDPWKAYCAHDGCRYGLEGACIET